MAGEYYHKSHQTHVTGTTVKWDNVPVKRYVEAKHITVAFNDTAMWSTAKQNDDGSEQL